MIISIYHTLYQRNYHINYHTIYYYFILKQYKKNSHNGITNQRIDSSTSPSPRKKEWSYSVAVITPDFESGNPSSNLGKTF